LRVQGPEKWAVNVDCGMKNEEGRKFLATFKLLDAIRHRVLKNEGK